MSRSTNENDSSSCEQDHNDSFLESRTDSNKTTDDIEDVYTHPFITDYDVGMVVEGPPPLQACDSCQHFKFTKQEYDKHLGVCHVSLPIINEDLIFENLNSSCWNFCLREDLLRLKIQRLRKQNANNITSKLHPE